MEPEPLAATPLVKTTGVDPAWLDRTIPLLVVPERFSGFEVVSPSWPAKIKAPVVSLIAPFWIEALLSALKELICSPPVMLVAPVKVDAVPAMTARPEPDFEK